MDARTEREIRACLANASRSEREARSQHLVASALGFLTQPTG